MITVQEGCLSIDCIFGEKKIGTNGGCGCLVNEAPRSRALILALKAQIKHLKQQLKYTVEEPEEDSHDPHFYCYH